MKRIIDITASSLGLLLLTPLLGVVALLVRVRLGSPVIFRQIRAGQHGKPFTMYKFRTMNDAFGASGQLLPDEDRLTSLGSRLRRTSIDELPELWNVLRGDMSLVGPRPLLLEYLPLYSPRQARRHEVRPGITGLAQVSGRNALSWEDRLDLDIRYVDTRTLLLDLKILVRTVTRVIQQEGTNHPGAATMPRFSGATPSCRDSDSLERSS
jgi:sugar transferase EpsL